MLQIAVNTVFLYSVTNICFGVFGELPKLARSFQAELLFHIRNVFALAAANEATISSRCAETNSLSLQQYDIETLLCKV